MEMIWKIYRTLKDLLHRGDRAMIYIFIAGSYFPWLSLTMPAHPTITFTLKWLIWILASLGIIYQQVNLSNIMINHSTLIYN